MKEIDDLVEISKYAGERFDLVQAGGGNSSVKVDNGEMLIKASGFSLSDLTQITGYSKVSTQQIASIVKNRTVLDSTEKRERESLVSELVRSATIDKINRPSIETLLHSLLLKYTLHTHPIVVNMIVIRKNWKATLSAIFSGYEIAFVEYETPGVELALALHNELQRFTFIPNIIFLQNHGLIVTSKNKADLKIKTEYVLEEIEKYLGVDMGRYKATSSITHIFNQVEKTNNIAYYSEDLYLNRMLAERKDLFIQTPFCPDSLVYCGISCVEIKNVHDIDAIQKYKNKYYELAKVLIIKNNLYFLAPNIRKAKEMEEVLKFHIMVLERNLKDEINFLELNELAYLSNWEAEEYRRTK